MQHGACLKNVFRKMYPRGAWWRIYPGFMSRTGRAGCSRGNDFSNTLSYRDDVKALSI